MGSGKKAGFEKVIGMIDSMVANLGKEQTDDDHLKAYCEASLDKADDKRKTLENSIADSGAAIDEMNGAIGQLTEQIAQITADVKALDKAVAEATELRQNENADHKKLMSDDTTAKELLNFAKNRLNKFYNPKLYKAPPKRELTAEERITVNLGGTVTTPAPSGIAGTGIGAAFVQTSSVVAPPPPPETFGAYNRKDEEGNGVIFMIDLLVADLDKEMQEATVDEKNSQKAATEESLQAETDHKADTTGEHMNTMKNIASLHAECDWLMQYYDVRKQARAGEVESLQNAKAVLSGAGYSFVQQGRLRGQITRHA